MRKIYLAIPYAWSPQRAFGIANRVAARLMREGHIVFSPITHGHPIADHLPADIRTDSAWWVERERSFIEWADDVLVIAPGEEGYDLISKSAGCQREMKIATELGKPVKTTQYLEP